MSKERRPMTIEKDKKSNRFIIWHVRCGYPEQIVVRYDELVELRVKLRKALGDDE